MLCIFFFFFFFEKSGTWWKGKNLNGEMTGNYCDPPLRKPSHHVVRPYRSLGKSEKDCAAEREGERCRDGSTEGNNVRLQKWLV